MRRTAAIEQLLSLTFIEPIIEPDALAGDHAACAAPTASSC